jgi:hypothetical protein
MKTHVRTNISLPVELKARMDRVDRPVNWSAQAAKAFGRFLADIDAGLDPDGDSLHAIVADLAERLTRVESAILERPPKARR